MTGSPANAEESPRLILETTQGQIDITMLPNFAPKHVERIFHRVIPGFMAQTGDPLGNGTGGSGQKLNEEFSGYRFRVGTVGMARSADPNSGDSQFFICFEGCDHLTGQYTVWGQVERGMENVYRIQTGEPPASPDQILTARIEE